MKGSKFFTSIDFASGYWQLPLAETSQLYHAFMTTNSVVQPTRTLQGGCNSSANFQGRVEPCFAKLRDNLKAWLDDFALHHKTESQLLSSLRNFLSICRDRNLKVSLPKSRFFQKELKWCGRIIDGEGVRYDPRNFERIVNCSLPVTAAELCEYVHCAQWMSQGIPEFSQRVAPLRALLENRTRRVEKEPRSLS
eukprot:IDg20209t1